MRIDRQTDTLITILCSLTGTEYAYEQGSMVSIERDHCYRRHLYSSVIIRQLGLIDILGTSWEDRLPGRSAKYSDEYVCLSDYVCLSALNPKTARPNFANFFCACCLVARFFFDGVAMCYVLPVL